MKKTLLVIGFLFFMLACAGIFIVQNHVFAQFPQESTGCCKLRDWLAGDWRVTNLSFEECDRLNRNRDSLDDLFENKGYVWWDGDCQR